MAMAAVAAEWITGRSVANHPDDAHPEDQLGSLPPDHKAGWR
jgi:hypothetical protein